MVCRRSLIGGLQESTGWLEETLISGLQEGSDWLVGFRQVLIGVLPESAGWLLELEHRLVICRRALIG